MTRTEQEIKCVPCGKVPGLLTPQWRQVLFEENGYMIPVLMCPECYMDWYFNGFEGEL